MTRTATAIRHVHFEDLGAFEAVLLDGGYEIDYCDVGLRDLHSLDPLRPELLIVLGGPIGVYEEDAYPFLAWERDILVARMEVNRPTLGVCLGAQLMAAALGAAVFPSGVKEIGFSPLSLTKAGCERPLRHLSDVPVLHWHGDTFDLPAGTVHLASTELCAQQAFARGSNIMGLQFHVEADVSALERWLIGHAAELAGARIDPRRLRAQAEKIGPTMAEAARAMFSDWLEALAF